VLGKDDRELSRVQAHMTAGRIGLLGLVSESIVCVERANQGNLRLAS